MAAPKTKSLAPVAVASDAPATTTVTTTTAVARVPVLYDNVAVAPGEAFELRVADLAQLLAAGAVEAEADTPADSAADAASDPTAGPA